MDHVLPNDLDDIYGPGADDADLAEDWTCVHCYGYGVEFPECERCEGKGWVNDLELGGTMTCPLCDNEECSVCQGSGERPENIKEREQ